MSSIPLGIGDLFFIRLVFDQHNLNHELILNTWILQRYRIDDENLNVFVERLMKHLFTNVRRIHDLSMNSSNPYLEYELRSPITLRSHFDLTPVLSEKYIVIHTKIRIDDIPNHGDRWKIPLREFFKKFRTNKTIVFMGEKSIARGTVEVDRHNITSLYELLLPLKESNVVIDLTSDSELFLHPDFDKFIHESKIIGNAECNYGLGWGGNFALSWGLSENYSFYIDQLDHQIIKSINKLNDPKKKLHRNINDFIESF